MNWKLLSVFGFLAICTTPIPAQAQSRQDTHVFCNGYTEPIQLMVRDLDARGPRGESVFPHNFLYLGASSSRYYDASDIINYGNCRSWTSDVYEDLNPTIGVFVDSSGYINPNGGTLTLRRRDFREDWRVAKTHYYACTSIGCYYSYSQGR